jgi:uncharacterized protein (DUF885 family)
MINRRDFVIGTSLIGAGAALAAPGSADATAQALLGDMAEELLQDYPENATGLGVDRGKRAGLKSRLADRSAEGQRAIAQRAQARLKRLQAIDPATLSEATRIDVDVMRTSHEFALGGFVFPYGDVTTLNQSWAYRNAPYVVSQNTGAFLEIPNMLDDRHTVETPADAQAYLSRMEAYAGQLDGETERLKAAAVRKVIAPDFLLDQALSQMKMARGGEVADWLLVRSLAKRTQNMPGTFAKQAEQIARDKVRPALNRQFDELTAHRQHATGDAGVWKLPDGDAYYAWALSAGTTTHMTPDEIHQMGQEQLQQLQGEMDGILRSLGLTQGTVGDRMSALASDKKYQFPEGDPGRAQILAYLEGRIADMRTRLPRAFATLVSGRLEIKRLPPEVEPGAPGAYGGPGTIDGKVPGRFWINLHTTDRHTRFSLPTLAYHESIPGHVWQGEYTFKLPLARSLLAFNAYTEGWALYAEQLADELGVYKDDPVGRLGYLQSIAFRACRLVVDTGLHSKHWTRQKAIEWFATSNGSGLEEVTSEVDRYCAWPGQACGYKVGHSEINRLRTQARSELGNRFDLRLFDDAVVKGGDVPLVVLARNIDAFIKKQPR